MLSPEARTVAVEFMRPPPGYRFDRALLTTYSLDLEALLALPLAALAHSDSSVDELMSDPLLLLQALRDTGDRIHVFVDRAGIAVPRVARGLYAMLESSVHPVRAPNGGVFHPKVWFVRFLGQDETPLVRVAVLSRNLTFDRSWDVALASEATPVGKRRKASSRSLGEMLRALAGMSTQPIPELLASQITKLATEVERTEFPAPEQFHGPIQFRALGFKRSRRRNFWFPVEHGSRVMAISPFLSDRVVQSLAEKAHGEKVLIGRQDELDGLRASSLDNWNHKLVLSGRAGSETDDNLADRPDGLHAKVIVIEHGWNVSWYVGSANATNAGYNGHNVELIAKITGRKSCAGMKAFAEAGFIEICEPYRRIEQAETNAELAEARHALKEAQTALIAEGAFRIECVPEESGWIFTIIGGVELPHGIDAVAWPLSLKEESSKSLKLPLTWRLPTNLLTTFVGFRLRARNVDVDDIRFSLLLPATGIPDNRMSHVLRSLIDSPERFMRFLRALLGGLDDLLDWSRSEGNSGAASEWGTGLGGEPVLEDLMRMAARQPTRLDPVRRLVEDLRATEEGRRIVPRDFLAVWNAVYAAVAQGREATQPAGNSIHRQTASASDLDAHS